LQLVDWQIGAKVSEGRGDSFIRVNQFLGRGNSTLLRNVVNHLPVSTVYNSVRLDSSGRPL